MKVALYARVSTSDKDQDPETQLMALREMERARKQGVRIGRPRVTDRRGFHRRFGDVLERLKAGNISRRQAARDLGIGYATLKRLLDAQAPKEVA